MGDDWNDLGGDCDAMGGIRPITRPESAWRSANYLYERSVRFQVRAVEAGEGGHEHSPIYVLAFVAALAVPAIGSIFSRERWHHAERTAAPILTMREGP